MRYAGILVFAVALYGGYQWFTSRPVDWPAGVLVEDDPRQANFEGGAPIARADFQLQPRARFSARVRVLSLEPYRHDRLAKISPLDFAVGWGRMSDTAVIEHLEISQSNRFYYWHFDQTPPIPMGEIVSHSANWHLIPANDAVLDELETVRTGEIVELEGQLVDVQNSSGQKMKTSLRRNDSGPGACEIIFVERLAVRYR